MADKSFGVKDLAIADKIAHIGDTGTAIRFPADDTFTVETSSQEAFRIDQSRRVFIGNNPVAGNSAADDLTIETTGNSGITIRSGSSSRGNIYFSDATSGIAQYAGSVIYEHSTDSLQLATSSEERLRIKSDGNVGIGTDNPTTTVHILDTQAELQLKSTSGTSLAGIRMVPGGQTNALYMYADGNRNITFDDHAVTLISVRSSGGITFNGDTAAANALDDYEEGTWTPVYNFSTSGDAPCNSVGRYSKVGNMVFIQCYVETSSSNSLNGIVLITGLPFAASNVTNRRSAFTIANAWNFPNSLANLRILLEPNASAIKMMNNATNGTEYRITHTDFTAAAGVNTLFFSGFYCV